MKLQPSLAVVCMVVCVSTMTTGEEWSTSLFGPTGLRGTSDGDANGAKMHEFVNDMFVSNHNDFIDSTCLEIDEEGPCNEPKEESTCVWCTGAVGPSMCLTLEQSKAAPSGIFHCDKNVLEESGTARSPTNQWTHWNRPGVTITLNDEPVDSSFCDPHSKSLSGYMDLSGSEYDANGEDKHLFYWFFEKRVPTKQDAETNDEIPLILWLTGGPGCSSTVALLIENGPCTVTADGNDTRVNPYSWTEVAHVLWLDQPAGVGYSYGKSTDTNEDMVAEDVYFFLQAFYTKHPEYQPNPLFVVGESYGGHYAPAIAHKIFVTNAQNDQDLSERHTLRKIPIHLKGLAVGNGLTNPIEQYKWYPEMAFHNSHGIQTVTENTYNSMSAAVSKCVLMIQFCNTGTTRFHEFTCQMALLFCNTMETTPYQKTGLNPYDIRQPCGDQPLCYDLRPIDTFLNLNSTKKALHISDNSHHWESCNMGIYTQFTVDWMKDFSPLVADLLNGGIKTLIYAGDLDFICNYLGNRAWTLNLEWDHKEEFNDAQEHEWGSDSGSASSGLGRSSNGFTFLQVYDAGHMVPLDQPKVALDMIHNFVQGKSF